LKLDGANISRLRAQPPAGTSVRPEPAPSRPVGALCDEPLT